MPTSPGKAAGTPCHGSLQAKRYGYASTAAASRSMPAPTGLRCMIAPPGIRWSHRPSIIARQRRLSKPGHWRLTKRSRWEAGCDANRAHPGLVAEPRSEGHRSAAGKPARAGGTKEPSYADFVDELLACEVDARRTRYLQARLKLAHLPFVKNFDQFEFAFQPFIGDRQIRKLRTLRFTTPATSSFSGRPAWAKPFSPASSGGKRVRRINACCSPPPWTC